MISSLPHAGDIDAVLADEVIESPVKDTEKEEGNEEHDDKVADENIVPAVGHVLPHLRRADSQLTLCARVVITGDRAGHVRAVPSVAGPQLVEPGDVPEEGQGDHWENEDVAGVPQCPSRGNNKWR